MDFKVHEKATHRSQDPDFVCSCLSKTLNYCTRKSEIHVTRSGFVRILDILILKWIRIAWPACHFFVGKLGFYCTRKSDIPVTGSGCIPFHLDLKYTKKPHARHKIRILLALVCRKPWITAHEKATYLLQDPDLFEFYIFWFSNGSGSRDRRVTFLLGN